VIRIGVDFGGTKIEAAAVDAEGRFLARARTPNPGQYIPSLLAVRQLVEHVEQKVGSRGAPVGVGHPGSTSPKTGKLRNANSTWLNDQPFQEHLESMLGRPVRLANDANCLALSEAVDGSGAHERVVFAAILGTGVGGGVAVDKQPLLGRNHIGGEWGHTPLPWPTGFGEEIPGPKCWCGRMGCLETWISGTGLQADYERETGRALKAEEIVELSRKGDLDAENALSRYHDRLARALAVVCDLLDPDIIVLGGGMSNVDELYDGLAESIAARVFSDVFDTPIFPAKWGDSSGVRGAAWLWPLE
jgi:fructokinase